MRAILISLVFSGLVQASCVAVSSDKILARDVRDVWPFLQGLDPETTIGFAPRPGVQRILSARDLIRIAREHRLDLTETIVASLCVERVVRPISPEEMRAALLLAIGVPDVELEVVGFSSEALPPGRLEFKPMHLGRPLREAPQTEVIWRGLLRYDLQSSIPVWAKVKLSVGCTLLVASEDIPAGTTIKAAQIKESHGRQFPFQPLSIQSSQMVVGKIARLSIPSGEKFAPGALEDPTEIFKGDTIRVSVLDGPATMSLDAVAQSSGKKGESILVHNPSSGKNFRGIVEQRGKVTVRSSPGI